MATSSLGLLAITLYVTAAVRVALGQRSNAVITHPVKVQIIGIAAAAIILHAILLYHATMTARGVNFGVFNAASMITWVIAVVLLAVSAVKPLESLAVVLLPLAALALAVDLLFPAVRILPDDAELGVVIHIALSISAYSLFSIACMQAIFLAVAEYKFRHHHPILNFLPPLYTMESLLFQITAIAFVLLTLGILLGVLFTEDIFQQHLAHKVTFSILAWVVFAVLLWGRWRFGWRGNRAVRYVVVGSILLAVGYFGSKIVLELILQRV